MTMFGIKKNCQTIVSNERHDFPRLANMGEKLWREVATQ